MSSVAQDIDAAFELCEIKAPDESIIAKFVPFGSTLTELHVKDREGKYRNVVLGYDDNTRLLTDPDHPVFNGIVGRYAGRIKNGTFSIPIAKDPKPDDCIVYHIPTNDHDGEISLVTLHGGINGWDRRSWTLIEKTPSSVTYQHVDNADEGFPGTVTAIATHTVSDGGVLRTRVHSDHADPTYILVFLQIFDSHWYLTPGCRNLDAFRDGNEDILSHFLRLDASRYIEVDQLAIPTGNLLDVNGGPLDFRKERQIGDRWEETVNLCGPGYNAGWVLDDPGEKRPVVSLRSHLSGIRLDISTNQPAVVVYTSYYLNTPRKEEHGGPALRYGPSSAIAIEQQGYIAAINTPEWGVDQIYQPGKDYEWRSEYKFSIF
ncbi:hypothetical protein CVT26_011573 [Gymnopilus dilepis]|uniref:Aldose 1-epimerase n=1 Tax=Gymnopilus dilepis TaxID=231916 RepID=A0A409YQM5_9AGAR|nr:hypothetical protein CVT26_011573 [Gymnopilus dilepis]